MKKRGSHNEMNALKILVFHRTDTHIQVLSLALALTIHNEQQELQVFVFHHTDTHIGLVFRSRFIDS